MIVDDHRLFREGIAEICNNEPDLLVIGQVDNGADAVSLVGQTFPDVVLLDIEMPGTDAAETLRRLLRIHPAPQVAILTMHDDARLVNRLMTLGARAYISKGATRQELLTAIRSIRDNRDHVMLSISSETMKRLDEPTLGPLSARELEVLELVAAGFRNSQIAARLHISEGTVKRHLTNIYLKLEVDSRMNAVNKALASGMLANERDDPIGPLADTTLW
ncbi:response regulator transcription factor [Streptosporangium oxazolinicum]|uniref:response regulator transcription factor n=1 Tax=Streptosporangium oxazolinicum TaxID=909287 RepID=UPI0031EBE914